MSGRRRAGRDRAVYAYQGIPTLVTAGSPSSEFAAGVIWSPGLADRLGPSVGDASAQADSDASPRPADRSGVTAHDRAGAYADAAAAPAAGRH